MVSGPPCVIHNDLNNYYELIIILQGVQPVEIPTFRPNSYFFSYFFLLFLLFDQTPTFTTFSNEDNDFDK